MTIFDSLSLRARFLIAPILGVVLTLILYLSSNQIITSNSAIFQNLSNTNLVQISEIHQVTILLTDSNNEIITLLLQSDDLDEEAIYVEGKKQLNQLYRIGDRLNESIGGKNSLLIDDKDIFEQIQTAYAAYRSQAISSIEMSSVDSKQATYELVFANQKLKVLNNLFFILSEHYADELAQQAKILEGTLYKKTYITELAIGLMILMLWTAFYFSKNATAGLTQVHKALNLLANGNTDVEVQHDNDEYIKNVWNAVAEFKESIISNEAYKNDLLIQKFAMDQHAIITTTDIKGNITYANDKFCEISGYSKDELLGSNHRILNSGNQPKTYWKTMFSTVSQGKTWNDEVQNVNKNGEKYWVDTTIIPMTLVNNKNKITGYISIRTDITQKKIQYQKLIEANTMAESAVIAKSQFLASMSHEIRTPMHGVIGMLDLIRDDELTATQQHRVGLAYKSAKSLLVLINDILDFSKIDANKLELECVSFDLFLFLQDLKDFMQYQAREKQLDLVLDISFSHTYVLGDSGRLRQILTNIIGNAIKFTHEGVITIKAILIPIDDNQLEFECHITDTGIGIPEQKLANLFDSFNQVDVSHSRKYGGTGLGLAISKRLAELMKGNISVTSEVAKGSVFKCSVQLEQSTKNTSQVQIEDKSVSATTIPTWPEHLKLLLVDDNRINLVVAQGLLKKFGLTAQVAHNGFEAIAALESANDPFDLIFMDCQMPEMDGYEATKQIRKHEKGFFNPAIPIIAMTANAMKGDREKCINSGMDDYLTKPIDHEVLLEKLTLWLLTRRKS